MLFPSFLISGKLSEHSSLLESAWLTSFWFLACAMGTQWRRLLQNNGLLWCLFNRSIKIEGLGRGLSWRGRLSRKHLWVVWGHERDALQISFPITAWAEARNGPPSRSWLRLLFCLVYLLQVCLGWRQRVVFAWQEKGIEQFGFARVSFNISLTWVFTPKTRLL